ncbi:MAG: tetratricopeptide repeat protein [Pseudomonadota bacterium]
MSNSIPRTALPTLVVNKMNEAVALHRQGKIDAAAAAYRELLRMAPRFPDARVGLGLILLARNQAEDGLHQFQRALEINPAQVDALINAGSACRELGQYARAVDYYRKALENLPEHDPNRQMAWHNMGNALYRMERWEEAFHCHEEAARLAPELPDPHFGMSLCLLALGRFEEGWREHEWRLHPSWVKRGGIKLPDTLRPQWQGEEVTGKIVAIWDEQGFGDSLQFVRYVTCLKDRGATVWIVARPELAALLESLTGVDRVIPQTDGSWTTQVDYWVPVMSLPHRCNMPEPLADIPYIRAPADKAAYWARRLEAYPGPRVGLVWAGNVSHKYDRFRSMKLEALGPLASLREISWFSLQKGAATRQLEHPPAGLEIIPLGQDFHDFSDTAAALVNLDLLITIDSAPAHLAGALGVPVWTLLFHAPDWRWQLERLDSPWYPDNMRLFRQEIPNDWSGVVREVTTALEAWQTAR